MTTASDLSWDDIVQGRAGHAGRQLFALILVAGGACRRSQRHSCAGEYPRRRAGAVPRSLRRANAARTPLLASPRFTGYGIIQTDGIRCAYHGWCYDRRGNVVDRPAEPIKSAPNIRHPWYPVQRIGRLCLCLHGNGKNSPPPLPRYDVLVHGRLSGRRTGRHRARQSLQLQLASGRGEYHGHHALTYLHGIYKQCPSFKTGGRRLRRDDLHLSSRGQSQSRRVAKRCTVLPTINRKSREPCDEKSGGLEQRRSSRRSGFVPIDDTHCEEMRLTVYPETPEEKSYHGGFVETGQTAREKTLRPEILRRDPRQSFRWKTKRWWKAKARSSTAPSNIPATATAPSCFCAK